MLKTMETKIFLIILLISIILLIYNIISKKSSSKTNNQIIYINSNKLVENIKNSIYDIDYREGLIYLPDYRNNKIIIIGKNNLVTKTIKTHAPHGIGVDNKGNIYVTDLLEKRIRKFNSDGKEIVDWDKKIYELIAGLRPYSIDTDSSENVYIALDNLIIKVSEAGQLIKKFDFSKLNYEKIYPHGITLHKNKIYVADRKNNKLLVFNTEGNYLSQFTSNMKSGFDPLSINIYSDTYFLVPNYKNSALHIFDMEGRELKIVGGKGADYGKWMFLTNVIDDKKGNIYTVEQNSNRLQIINFSILLKKI